MKAVNYIKLEFPGRSSNEALARAAAAAFALQLDPTLEELGDIKTAVSEAVTNCIVHAYPDTVGKIRMRLRVLEGGLLEIAVQDWGCGMDKLRVRSRPGRGTTVVMQRRVRSRAERP